LSVREVVLYPAEVLRRPAEVVTTFDENLRTLVTDMFDTMYAARGVGLAAPQVGVSSRVFVMDPQHDDEPIGPTALINPVIVRLSGEQTFEEGCLSIPGFAADVVRAESVRVEYRTLDGEETALELSGYPAVIAQHEIDHLDGILFVDYLSPTRSRLFEKDYGRDIWRWRFRAADKAAVRR
jgi:peptide deformylase